MTRPQQIANLAPPGSLLKNPLEPRRHKPIRQPREADTEYLALIRQLPCLKCGIEPCGCAAHVRLNSAAHGKRQAMGQKPDDKWTVPLCHGCHQTDRDAQHKVGELPFWHAIGISPFLVCKKLYAAAPDVAAMRMVVVAFINARRS